MAPAALLVCRETLHPRAVEQPALDVDLRDSPGIRDVVERIRVENDKARLLSCRQCPQILQAHVLQTAGDGGQLDQGERVAGGLVQDPAALSRRQGIGALLQEAR